MANERPEQIMLDKLNLKCNSIKGWIVHTSNCRSRNYMDFEATVSINDQVLYLKCEAKVASKMNKDGSEDVNYGDRHNVNHKVFGEIIKGRTLKDYKPNNENKVYGMIFPKRDFKFFNSKYKNMISDWEVFGKTFNAKYVFVYDEHTNILEVYSWSNIWKNTKPYKTF